MSKWNFCAISAFGLAATLLGTSDASAAFDPTTITGLTNTIVTDIVRTAASGGDYRSFSGASSMGLTGMDVGVDVVGIWTPTDFRSGVALMTGQGASEIPSLIPFPRFSLRKGLPFGIDLGLSFIPSGIYPSFNVQSWGGEVKWAFLSNPLLPNVAARFTANYSQLWFIETRTYKFEFVGSKKFGPIEPYVSAGYQFWNGGLSLPVTLAQGLPAINVTGNASDSNLVLGAGLSFSMVFMKLVAEYDYNATGAGVQTVGGRAVFSF